MVGSAQVERLEVVEAGQVGPEHPDAHLQEIRGILASCLSYALCLEGTAGSIQH